MLLDEKQARAATTYGASLAVMAGAGSGKTQTMRARVVDAFVARAADETLENGAVLKAHGQVVSSIGEVLAITFTEAAASELKDRIKSALRESGDPDVRAQALLVDDAWISTIHGMCSRLLKENAFSLGVDPSFSVVADTERDVLIDDAIERALATSPVGHDLLLEYDSDSDYKRGLQTMVRNLIGAAVKSPALFDSFVLPPEGDVRSILGYLQQALANDPKADQARLKEEDPTTAYSLAGLGTDGDAAALAELERVLAQDQVTLEDALGVCALFSLKGNGVSTDKAVPVMQDWDCPWVSQGPFNRRSALSLCVLSLELMQTNHHLAAVVDIAREAYGMFQKNKQDRGLMDNDDLLLATHSALQDDRIRTQYADKFKLVIVDEFQDTNQLQLDIIRNFTGQHDNRLCVVGDRMQSIYRFQGADVSVCNGHLDTSAQETLNIDNNYRSHADIIGFVDTVFSDLGCEYLRLVPKHAEPAPSAAYQPYCVSDAGKRVEVLEIQQPAAAYVDDRARRLAAAHIAASFKRMHDSCELAGCPRSYGDMVILLSAMTNANVYADALRAQGIPCAIVKGSVMKKAYEAIMLVRVLDALADPANTQALFQVLRNDLFSLSDQDLVDLAGLSHADNTAAGNLASCFDAYVAACERGASTDDALAGLSDRARRAVTTLGNARVRLGTTTVHEVLNGIVVESGLLERLRGADAQHAAEGLAKAANVFKVVRLVKEMEDEGVHGSSALAARLRAHIEGAGETPGNLASAAGDFVRIMTIHASKGLAFPVVALSELQGWDSTETLRIESSRGKSYLVLDAGKTLVQQGGALAGKVGPYTAGLVDEARFADPAVLEDVVACSKDLGCGALFASGVAAFHAQQEAAELERKIYVGMTRAEEAMIVVAFNKVGVTEIREALASGQCAAALDNLGLEAKGSEGFINANGLDGNLSGSLREMHRKRKDIVAGGAVYNTVTPMWLAAWDATGVLPPQLRGAQGSSEDADGFDLRSVDRPVDGAADGVPDGATQDGSEEPFAAYQDADMNAPWQFHYAPNWTAGVVSASLLKAADHGYVQEETPAPADVFAEEGDLVEEAAPKADATARGLAFHALAEWAIRQRKPGGALVKPLQERVEAICRFNGLDAADVADVDAMLDAWFASPVAAWIAGRDTVVAEAPFFLRLDAGAGATEESRATSASAADRVPLLLNGFIDAFAYDGSSAGGRVWVVDYKTGTTLDTSEVRREAYEVQALVYAYALLQQGFAEVNLQFVFVEQGEGGALPVEHFPAQDAFYQDVEALRSQVLGRLRGVSLKSLS